MEEELKKLKMEEAEIHQTLSRLNSENDVLTNYSESIVDVSKGNKNLQEMINQETLKGVSEFMKFYKLQMKRIDDERYKLQKKLSGIVIIENKK